jgi:hypothetical protein
MKWLTEKFNQISVCHLRSEASSTSLTLPSPVGRLAASDGENLDAREIQLADKNDMEHFSRNFRLFKKGWPTGCGFLFARNIGIPDPEIAKT